MAERIVCLHVLMFSCTPTADSFSREMTDRKQCSYVLPKKRRRCRMKAFSEYDYCGEHLLIADVTLDSDHERIVCPLDPTHTCFVSLLEKHLKKCNARHKNNQVYFVENCNSGIQTPIAVHKVALNDLSDEQLEAVITKMDSIYKKHVNEPHWHLNCAGEELEEEIDRFSGSSVAVKHLRQQAALLGLAREHNLLSLEDVCYAEFGAGRGRLAYWIAKSIPEQGCSVLLVDRAAPRHKFENKLDDSFTAVERIRIDIQHLELGNVESVKRHRGNVVGFCKHLCGEATDFALRCMTTSKSSRDTELHLQGAVMAVCCHHRCSWNSFVGRSHLELWGISQADFAVLRCLAGWATCACSQDGSKSEKDEVDENEQKEGSNVQRVTRLCLSVAERQEIGRRCKLLLDTARVAYLTQLGFRASVVYFVTPCVTPENVAILVLPPSQNEG
ncbi:tRNA:m(4)X modification enzyme TRM13 homolog isoform X2 [Ornithodoros turicata]|uniref:tRNA:m(4)X modification enzyme TRM13 homolog isoform X2 n=1 Tax=Ornithodoros turicata TaxID=34597 RepID=UPI003139C307